MTRQDVLAIARECGFELAGIAAAVPSSDGARYHQWVYAGMAGAMGYLTDRRARVRNDPRNMLPSAKSILCVGKLYNGPEPYSTSFSAPGRAWISRYAWGDDYHEVLRAGLARVVGHLREHSDFEHKICVDTAPLLERSYARDAGLGWIGKNTCLINQQSGSWFFLGELLLSLPLEADTAPPDRCGSCTRCIDACPTAAIVPFDNRYTIDSRLCISYLTIELRAGIPEEHRAAMGNHVFGCDICQDVCPWNRRAPDNADPEFGPRHFAPPLDELAVITEDEFRSAFAGTPINRTRYSGFLRNVAIAMGNSGEPRFRDHLEHLASNADSMVAETAAWALDRVS